MDKRGLVESLFEVRDAQESVLGGPRSTVTPGGIQMPQVSRDVSKAPSFTWTLWLQMSGLHLSMVMQSNCQQDLAGLLHGGHP